MEAEALSPESATELIRTIVKLGEIDLSPHARKQMRARGFDLSDLLLVLSSGKVTDEPEYDDEHQNFKYRVTGPTLDDDQGTAIVVFLDHRSLYVVTVFGNGERP